MQETWYQDSRLLLSAPTSLFDFRDCLEHLHDLILSHVVLPQVGEVVTANEEGHFLQLREGGSANAKLARRGPLDRLRRKCLYSTVPNQG